MDGLLRGAEANTEGKGVLLLTSILRPEGLFTAIDAYVLAAMKDRFHKVWRSYRSAVDLQAVVEELSGTITPITIVSSSGDDQASSVEHLARQQKGQTAHQVSMGSPEGFCLQTSC